MGKPLFYLIILSCLFTEFSFAQEPQEIILGKFIITDAKVNGLDVTQEILEAEAFTVFYMYENEEGLHMANVWPKKNSQSYGLASSFSIEYQKETYESYEADYFSFDWNFTNNYDQKSGTAKVSVIEINKPQEIHYILKMVTEELETIIYKGYMEGSLNFSEFE